MRYPKHIIPLSGACISFCINLIVLRPWQGASGLDIYYYALQAKALAVAGEQLFSDQSPVYRVLWAVNCLLLNPVVSVQVVSGLSIALVYFCLLVIALRGGITLYKAAAATIVVFNPATFYLLLEFTKNSFAFALFFLAWVLVTDDENKIRVTPKTTPAVIRLIAGLLLLALSAFSHRMMLMLFLCFVVHAGIVSLWQPDRRPAKKTIQFTVILFGVTLLVIGAAAFSQRSLIAERLSVLSLSAPLHRMAQFVRGSLLPGEHTFYVIIQLAVSLLVPAAVVIRRQFSRSEVIFAAVAWLFLFPFLEFGWDEIGFRLLILAPLMLGPWLMTLEPSAGSDRPQAVRRRRGGSLFDTVTPGVLCAASVFFTVESALNLAVVKGPDYRTYDETFASIEDLVNGRRLIAHRGLAGYLWYEKGIRSENFLPVGEPEKYLRVVYAFSPDVLEYYLEPGDPLPVPLDKNYMLIEEYIWQRFYHDRGELRFLKSEMNPFLPRPRSAFAINEKVSAIMEVGVKYSREGF